MRCLSIQEPCNNLCVTGHWVTQSNYSTHSTYSTYLTSSLRRGLNELDVVDPDLAAIRPVELAGRRSPDPDDPALRFGRSLKRNRQLCPIIVPVKAFDVP